VRCCYAADKEQIREAMARLKRFVARVRRPAAAAT
jgi:aspartate/methionine/tyrosine aminotransferase